MGSEEHPPRVATVDDAGEVARLLHDFNVEFATPTPGAEVLTARLRELLAGDVTFALLAGAPGAPAAGVALATLRPNVWYAGQVALLDELYVVPHLRSRGIGAALVGLLVATARERHVDLVEVNVDEPDVDALRFYARHGFSLIDPDSNERAFYISRELAPPL